MILSWKIALFTLCLLFGGRGSVYAETYVVVETSEEWVTCVDYNGEEFAFENVAQDWERGDYASCIVYDNGTDIIYDDEILTAKYSGFCRGKWGYDYLTGASVVEFDD